ncbi:MAG: ribbon-helix-helix domain-containing protein [Rhodospirillaceae bacterium]|nr:ribbon-helix-helix domain-containing protein [Rhodospirillaceae bacterium]
MSSIDSKLVSRNVTISGHRTSIRLEVHMWEAFDEICAREGMSAHQLCSMIDDNRNDSSRTAAVRAFAVNYFRSAATEDGHRSAGHGKIPENTSAIYGNGNVRSLSA